jgi:hypothetical protein
MLAFSFWIFPSARRTAALSSPSASPSCRAAFLLVFFSSAPLPFSSPSALPIRRAQRSLSQVSAVTVSAVCSPPLPVSLPLSPADVASSTAGSAGMLVDFHF